MRTTNIYSLSQKKKPFVHSGVYFLFKNNKLVYIGQSMRIEERIIWHVTRIDKSHGKIVFDSYAILEMNGSKKERMVMESELISKYKPRYNLNGK